MFLALIWTFSPHALAGRGPLDVLALPADVDVVLCAREAGGATGGASLRTGQRMMDELSAQLGLPAAWAELWKALDLPPQQAVDELLGRRVLVAVRWPAGAAGIADDQAPRARPAPQPDWVVISLVSQGTERRIRERLRPAPRDVEFGQAILSLEDGRFLLTSRVLEAAPGSGEQRLAVLMLAPSAHVLLFKQMLPRLGERAPGPSLGDDARIAQFGRLLDADIALLTVGRAAPGGLREISALGAWWRTGDALEARGPGLDAKLVRSGVATDRLLARAAAGGGLSRGQIDHLADGSLLALADVLPVRVTPEGEAQPAPDQDGGGAAFTFPTGPNLASIVGGMVRMLDLTPEQADLALGTQTIAVVHGSGRREDPLCLTLGVASQDLSVLAPSGDRLMGAMLAVPALAAAGPQAGPEFRGVYPPAVRVCEVPEGSLAHLNGLLGDQPAIAWQFAPMQGAVAGPRPGADEQDRTASPARVSPWAVPGWWLVRLSQAPLTPAGEAVEGWASNGGDARALRDTSALLTGKPGDARVVMAGVVRPARLMAALVMAMHGVPIPPAMAAAMRWVDRIRWEGTLAPEQHLVVEIAIDLNPGMGATPE